MFQLTREWILVNQRWVRFCVGEGGGVKFWASTVEGGLTEKILFWSQTGVELRAIVLTFQICTFLPASL